MEDKTKYVLVYLFKDYKGINLDFKALSADIKLQNDFVFMAVENPSLQTRREFNDALPSMHGMFREGKFNSAGV